MQRKQGWKLDGSGFWKKINKQQTIIYALSSLSAQNRIKKKNPNGKAEWKK